MFIVVSPLKKFSYINIAHLTEKSNRFYGDIFPGRWKKAGQAEKNML